MEQTNKKYLHIFKKYTKPIFYILAVTVFLGELVLLMQSLPQQKENRSRALASTTLSFQPASTQTSPIVKYVNQTVPLDVYVDPGTNMISLVKLEINYDSTRLQPTTATPFVVNSAAFPVTLEGPSYTTGKITVTVSIGSDRTKAVTTLTKVGTINFIAAGLSYGTTTVSYGAATQALSIGPNDQATENVLSQEIPAYIQVSALPTNTPVPTITPLPTNTPIPTATPFPTPAITFTANPTSIAYNDASILTWSTTNATSCTASGSWTGAKATSGSESTGNLTSTRTYTLTCTGPGGTGSKSITVTVATPPTPTVTPVPSNLKLTVFLHGIGESGDSTNPILTTLSNKSPKRTSRSVTVQIYDASNNLVATDTGNIVYQSGTGNFTGTIVFDQPINAGSYLVKVTTPMYLRKSIPGIITLGSGTYQLQAITMVVGDVNSDNKLDILDYNMIRNCYSDFLPPISCDANSKLMTDITDDGNVNQYDYNLFLREINVQNGD